MDTLSILKSIDFGESVAELEAQNLEDYFIETHQWQNIRKGNVDIVYGPKGSGKSAIYSLIDSREPQFFQNNIVLKFAENPRGATVFSDLKADPPPSEQYFIHLWKLYLLTLIGEHFEAFGTYTDGGREVVKALKESGFILESNPLKLFLGNALNYLKKYFNPDSVEPNLSFDNTTGALVGAGLNISFTEPSMEDAAAGVHSVDTLLHKANEDLKSSGFSIWFLLDRLDVAFADSPELEENALRALFKTYLDFAGYENIQLRIFLRTDIWESITRGGFREATHVRRYTTIDWDRAGILNLIMRRFVSNEAVRQRYQVDVDKMSESQDYQEKLFYKIFPEQVDTGRNPRTLDWLIGRVEDSKGYSAPRDIINLINAALRDQIQDLEIGGDHPTGQRLLSRSALKEGLNVASREKVEKFLFAEHHSLRTYFDDLRGEKTSQTAETLSELWSIPKEEAEEVAERIVETGVWKKRGSDPVRYWTMFLFRNGLEMVQGKAK